MLKIFFLILFEVPEIIYQITKSKKEILQKKGLAKFIFIYSKIISILSRFPMIPVRTAILYFKMFSSIKEDVFNTVDICYYFCYFC
jgi:hypothetical protein